MLSFLRDVFDWYLGFFVLCLVPSIILGPIFQYLVSKPKFRRAATLWLTLIGFIASIFVNYYVLSISFKKDIFYLMVITITLSTFIVSLIRSCLLNKRQCYINSFLEVVKTTVFAMFVTPIVMGIIFGPIFFSLIYFFSL